MDKASRNEAWSLWTGRRGGSPRADRGEPERTHGRRANRRAGHTQTVRYGPFGGVKVTRGAKEQDLRDRWRG